MMAKTMENIPNCENGIILMILANCVATALLRPTEDSEFGMCNCMEKTVNCCFTAEIVVRC